MWSFLVVCAHTGCDTESERPAPQIWLSTGTDQDVDQDRRPTEIADRNRDPVWPGRESECPRPTRQQAESLNSLAKVCQGSTNSLPNAAKPQVNAALTSSPENPFPTPIRPHETISETVPRLRRDCSETNGRPLEDSIFRIKPEMLEQETRQRTGRSECPNLYSP